MFQRGFGNVGSFGSGPFGGGGEFERMTRQYWDAWGQAMRGAVPGTAPPPAESGTRAWHDALQWWSGQFADRPLVGDTLGRFGQQAGQWYAQMHEVAARLAGNPGSPAEIVKAWKDALGSSASQIFSDLLDAMGGRGLHGMGEWLRSAQLALDALKSGSNTWLNLPDVGFAREHQQRLKALAQAQLEAQQATQRYNSLMVDASRDAFARFEQMLEQRAEDGQPVQTPHALFDLWVDAAEQAYTEVALSEDYRRAWAELANAQMRLRAGIQHEIEHLCAQLGMPARSELDSAHRKIVELQRSVRALQEQSQNRHTGQQQPQSAATAQPAKKTAAKTAKRAAKKMPAPDA